MLPTDDFPAIDAPRLTLTSDFLQPSLWYATGQPMWWVARQRMLLGEMPQNMAMPIQARTVLERWFNVPPSDCTPL